MTTFTLAGQRKTPRANVFVQIFNWLLIARQRRELAQLDDYALEDMGLSRADVAQEIKRPLWDVPAHRCG
ncbi:DUF1127 domain-containing protein [Shimia haliotis]|uniref:YjiS-like domain-containing protein n=1 Tax=Shimia haliotis TaxID=1280847 RepID=A0A1I4F5X5_9RHOB|nr:DUF1127 domain-containing protein [Shimia haliotis]SFL13358.1 protein of unknown function [Shimia haliotis]